MKNLFFTLALFSTAQLAFAQVPRITDKKFGNYQNFTVNEKAEVGTFFLLQSLVAKELIGGKSGVCVNYKRGDGSTKDEITFAVKSTAPDSGYATKSAESQAEINKLKPVLGQMKKFFSKNCENLKPKEMKSCIDIAITGYSDGTRAAGIVNPTASIDANEKLATARANLYAADVDESKITDYGSITTQGSPSKFGNYLDIIKKVHNGNFNSFLKSLKEPAEYNYALLKKDRFQNILSGKEKYQIDCPARRVTTLDFKFNPSSVQFAENTQTSVSPSLYAGGAEFNFNALIDVGLQVGEVTNGESLKNSSNDEVDAVIEKVMKNSGVTDPDMLADCKGNDGARQMVRFLSKQVNSLSPAKRTQLLVESRKDKTAVLLNMRDANANPAYKAMFDSMANEVDNRNKYSDFPGQYDGGLSNTKLNCFGVKSTLKAYAKTDGDKIKKACVPLEGASTKVKFNAKKTHIGCTQCGTGLRVEEVSYKDPASGLLSKVIEPVYLPREKNLRFSDHVNASKVSGFVSVDKLEGHVASLKKIQPKEIPPNVSYLQRNFLTAFNVEIASIPAGGSFPQLKSYTSSKFITHAAILKQIYGVEEKDLEALSSFIRITSTSYTLKPEDAAAKEYYLAGLKNKDMSAAKEFYVKAARPNPFDPMETARHSEDSGSQLTMGGLKGPSYYELDNCDCSDPALLDNVIANGKRHNITDVSDVNSKAGSCIVSLPIPTSCMVSPNNPGGDVHSSKHTDSKISWIDADGEEVNALLDNLAAEVAKTNNNFDFQGCKEASPFSLAQEVVNSVRCDPSQGFVLPIDEFKDCGG